VPDRCRLLPTDGYKQHQLKKLPIDEKSYNVDENLWFKDVNLVMGDHPLIWYQNIGRGRSLQTALGHMPELYDSEMFRKHLTGAILWVAGKADED